MNYLVFLFFLISLISSGVAYSYECNQFEGSTLYIGSVPDVVKLNTDYPTHISGFQAPWADINYQDDWKRYMSTVFSTIENEVTIENNRIRLNPSSSWYEALWMDYGNAGREPLNGLTRERGPDEGDVAPSSPEGGQVWAIGWYNHVGAKTFAEIYEDPCNPKLQERVDFEVGTVSIKFLFTTLDKKVIPYLDGSPEINAMIDSKENEGDRVKAIPENRVKRKLRLLQVDLAVRDNAAAETGWIFATYVWAQSGKTNWKDNLVPVTLMWGDDPKVYDNQIKQSIINTNLRGKLYGWDKRPFLGFMGRGNGPADNSRSSCISCHASAQYPRPSIGNLNPRIDLEKAQTDFQYRKEHVDQRFNNLQSGDSFDSSVKNAVGLAYSLQIQGGIERLCAAWCDKVVTSEPDICKYDPYRYVPRRCLVLKERQNLFQNMMLDVKEIFRSEEDNLKEIEAAYQLDNPRGGTLPEKE